MTNPGEEPGFFADVRAAVTLWRGALVVPVLYGLIAIVTCLGVVVAPQPVSHCAHRIQGSCPTHAGVGVYVMFLVSIPIFVFQVGLSGTARVWYALRVKGETLELGEIWRLSWRFLGRFLIIGLLVLVFLAPFSAAGELFAALANSSVPEVVFIAVGAVIADVALTFVTPWLALFEPRPRRALRGGLQILRASWPRCAPYVLVPPLALQLLGIMLRTHVDRWPLAVMAFTGPLLTLAFAGATTLFLLRRYPPPSPYGSLMPAYAPTGPVHQPDGMENASD